MNTIVIATKNIGKIKEFQTMLEPEGFQILSLLDFESITDVEETGTTFEENAKLKAETICELIQKPVIADDSGLEVDALNGEPGVYSARYAGAAKNDDMNIDKLLKELEGTENRSARFVCALAVAIPDKPSSVFRGTCEGEIALMRSGSNGFGYDPVFYLPDKKKTMAELEKEEKNKISHRAAALKHLQETLNLNDLK
ncbi:XTP/dITP diphosphatase [Fictibacillus aquaticus]|uniref:dITP/XTP pyrophosphatase n=1 Tax=Fictibacillus aquaticus TaxID=2021314 RepID=A0A235FBG4_9BACL|nr:XTP/dITP diphosphatase [Fictibacillus aquaticus]OYD58105.1 non-canonical purine NTP pyrophosphatase [Fictibacillus aquaticus]